MGAPGSNEVLYLAAANHRNVNRVFGIKQRDRRSHIYIVGKTGTGKSTLLRNMALQDIAACRGIAVFDPHGDLVEELRRQVPQSRQDDLVYLDTPRGNWTFNPIADVPPGQESLATAEMIEVFRKIWAEDWGPRLEHLLRNVIFTLLEMSNASLLDAQRLLTDRELRVRTAEALSNPEVREYWLREYARYSPAFRAVVAAPLQNKLGALLTDPRVRSIIAARRSSFDLAGVLENGKVLLVNLSRGQIGEGPSMILGALLAAHVGLNGLSRADRAANRRRDFHVYMDEFQVFATRSLATMLAELRKYRVSLTLANQYLSQLHPEVRDAVVGNVGTLIAFRTSTADAGYLARQFEPVFKPRDLIGLPNFSIYLRLLIDGEVSKPFSAHALPLQSAGREADAGGWALRR